MKRPTWYILNYTLYLLLVNHEKGGYYAYVSSKFSNALIVVDPDPDYDGNADDAYVAGKIVLVDDDEIDDPVIGYAGMGGQGVLAIPNVYDGWIQETVSACQSGSCGDVSTYTGQLIGSQKNP